jgi:L-histidine N-alpha-methyltransferase
MTSVARVSAPRGNPRMLAEVAAGLAAPQKELPPKYFYDHRGSELFEEITRLPEYYLTRAERRLLESWMPRLIPSLGTRALVELGAGSGEKTRVILDAMQHTGTAELYVPIDVSAAFLRETAERLRRRYPGLAVTPAVADIAEELVRCRRPRSTSSSAAPSATSIRLRRSACSRGCARPCGRKTGS